MNAPATLEQLRTAADRLDYLLGWQPRSIADLQVEIAAAPTTEEVVRIVEEFQREAERQSPDLSKIKTGIPALDRALPVVKGRRDAVFLARRLCQLRNEAERDVKGAPKGLRPDYAERIRDAERATNLLREGAELLHGIGAGHLADLASDLARASFFARHGPVNLLAASPATGQPITVRPTDGVLFRLAAALDSSGRPVLALDWHAKPGGKAKSSSAAAANGAAVRCIAEYIKDNAPERFAIISDLCVAAGYAVTPPTVRKIIRGYSGAAEETPIPAKASPDLLTLIPAPKK